MFKISYFYRLISDDILKYFNILYLILNLIRVSHATDDLTASELHF